MKKLFLVFAVFVSSYIGLSGATITIGTGTSTQGYPFYGLWGYTRSASLYTAAEVTTGKQITALAWNVETSKNTDIPIKIYIKTTTESVLTANTWANMISGATLVYDGIVKFNNTGWKTINLSTPFTYCNDNLLILCEANFGGTGAGSSQYPYFYYTSNSSMHENWYADNNAPTGNGNVGSSRPNIQITYSTPTFCSGTPTAGTVSASPTAVCSGNPTILTVSGSTSGVCGLTFQWQSSANAGGPWTNISGATSATYTATPTSPTYYRRIIYCGSNSATTNSVFVSINNPATCYCIPASNNTTYYVSAFETTGGTTNINNNTGACSAGGYGNFTAQTVTQEQGMSVNFSSTIVGSSGFSIWVDWNQDGDFADSDEQVFVSTSYGTSFNGSFSVPITALTGSTRMRVRSNYNDSSPDDPCSSITYGEAEDYTFKVTVAQSMTYTSSAVTQTNFTSVSPGEINREIIGVQIVTSHSLSPLSVTSFSFTTTGTTAPTADIQNARLWYTGTNGTFATTTQIGSAVASPNGTFTIATSQVLEAGTNYFWLTYDIRAGATINNYIDATCTSVTVGSVRTPSPTTVAGNRQILNITTIGTGTSNNGYPFYAYYGYSRSAAIYTAAEIGAAGIITHLGWNVATAQSTVIPSKIYLKITNDIVLTSQTWASLIDGATLVYDANVQYTPAGWKTLDITNFNYCTGNLMVLCEANYGGSGTSPYPYFYYTTTSDYKHETFTADGSAPTSTGSLSKFRPNIQITKAPPIQCSGTPTAGTITATPSSVTNCSTPIVLNAIGYTTTCGMNYQWQWSSDNVTWSNIPSGTTIPFSTTPIGNITYYRLMVTCTNSATTAYSSSVSVTGTAASSALSYSFSATSGTYTPITGGTQIHGAGVDGSCKADYPIGFNFQYACQTFTSVSVSTDGYLTFNSTTTNYLSNNLTTNSPGYVVAPLWDDLSTFTSPSEVRYKTTGTSPNRIFTVEWYNMEWNYNSSSADISFQVKLYETSNIIKFIYNDLSGSINSASASIGLTGAGAN